MTTAIAFSTVAVEETPAEMMTAAQIEAEIAMHRAEIEKIAAQYDDLYEGVSDEEMESLKELRGLFRTAIEIGERMEDDEAQEAAAYALAAREEYLNSLTEDEYYAETCSAWKDEETEVTTVISLTNYRVDPELAMLRAEVRALRQAMRNTDECLAQMKRRARALKAKRQRRQRRQRRAT